MTQERLLVVLCGLIALLDATQLVVRDWQPGLMGAIGGAVVYGVSAVLIGQHRRWAWNIPRYLPLLPTAVIALWLLGMSPREPDAWMLSIYAVQLVTSAVTFKPGQ